LLPRYGGWCGLWRRVKFWDFGNMEEFFIPEYICHVSSPNSFAEPHSCCELIPRE
jgi:hypothetical protein